MKSGYARAVGVGTVMLILVGSMTVISMDGFSTHYKDRINGVEERAGERYDEYDVTESSVCWDLCAKTAVPDVWPTKPYSDKDVQSIVETQLYVFGAYATPAELAEILPVTEPRVEKALLELEADGIVKSGTRNRGWIPENAEVYAHHTVPRDPAGPDYTIVELTIIAAGITATIAVIIHVSSRSNPW